mgnify:FL=1
MVFSVLLIKETGLEANMQETPKQIEALRHTLDRRLDGIEYQIDRIAKIMLSIEQVMMK